MLRFGKLILVCYKTLYVHLLRSSLTIGVVHGVTDGLLLLTDLNKNLPLNTSCILQLLLLRGSSWVCLELSTEICFLEEKTPCCDKIGNVLHFPLLHCLRSGNLYHYLTLVPPVC